jgi:multimeric flavodoxin WrbA
MKILILDGVAGVERDWEGYLTEMEGILKHAGQSVERLKLREMDILHCTGCFGCWVKTPGRCVLKDDTDVLDRAIIQSDFMLWAAPLSMGFPSALLKKAMDKHLPLIHPYFAVVENEAHHRARYAHYPRVGLLVKPEKGTSPAEMETLTDIFARTALNFKSRLEFAVSTDQPAAETARAILNPAKGKHLFKKGLKAIPGARIAPPKKLTFFNGSPRGRNGNTPLLVKQFLKGFESLPGRTSEIYNLTRGQDAALHQRAFREAECVLLGFPLYTDAMPGIVKKFIEDLAELEGRAGNPPLLFLVQSGFPEATHSRHVERYMQGLAGRLGSPYLGTMLRGEGEGLRVMPENMTAGLFGIMEALGRGFGESGRLDADILKKLAGLERFPVVAAPIFKLISKTHLLSNYWDRQLKENGVYETRDERPYE